MMLRFITTLVLIFLFISPNITFAQKQLPLDSINEVLKNIIEPNKKVNTILNFINKPKNKFQTSTKDLAIRALDISNNENLTKEKINSMLYLSDFELRDLNYEPAMHYALKAKTISEDFNYKRELAQSLNSIGKVYFELKNYNKSSEYFFESLKLFEKVNDKKGIADVKGNIGLIFFQQLDYTKALDYFNVALQIALKLDEDLLIKKQYNNIGVVYGSLKKYDSSSVYINRAMEINKKYGDENAFALNLMNIGYNLLNTNKSKEAINHFEDALEIFTKLENHTQIAACFLNLGYCYYMSDNIDKSVIQYKNAIKYADINSDFNTSGNAAYILSQIYLKKKDSLEALKYVLIEKTALDSIYSGQRQKLVSNYELQYDFDKKEFENKLSQKRKSTIFLFIIFSLFFSSIVLLLILSKNKLRSKYITLEKEKIEAELNVGKKELSINLISLVKKNEMLSELSKKLIGIQKNAKSIETKQAILKISKELKKSAEDKRYNEFSSRFKEAHAGFYEKLLEQYPDLTQNELNLCAYLRLNMTTKDISEITGQRIQSIDQARYRLRKKLEISNSEINLTAFLTKI